ncbi:hypothetical protein OFY17_09025 [Marinomonas sp. C2222]|uniref:Uncharacterized protein n=1 Tax=Marinomonas sargassi TaxID=2984494 RepID=A0ABT2YT01_9GAMM|nr:HAD family hydrolase [Marinomonas sargassi]MCV2403017.1 hypothetical protein [Marinomonas sargassi]
MKYGYTYESTNWDREAFNSWGMRLLRLLLFFIPRANPDHEKLYLEVARWFLEIDDNGLPQREIGINSDGAPIFVAPDNRNLGMWTDFPHVFDESKLELASKEEFESVLKKLKEKA